MLSRCDTRIVAAGSNNKKNPSPIFASSKLLRLLSNKWNKILNSAITTDNGNESTVYIPEIPHNIMDRILKYTKRTFLDRDLEPILVCDENVQEYFHAGQFLEMDDVVQFCLDFLESRKSTIKNISILFNLIPVVDETFKDRVNSKIRDFLIKNSHQLDVVVRNCRRRGVSEDTLKSSLLNLLNSKENLTKMNSNLDWDLDKLLPEFSNQEDQLVILDTFFENADAAGKTKAFRLLLNMVKNHSSSPTKWSQNNSSASSASFSASSSTPTGIDTTESLNLKEFQVNLDNFDNLPPWLKEQMSQLEKNDTFPSFTFVNHCFFESESLRRAFCFISPLVTCSQNQRKNWLCDPHSECTNKFNVMERSQPPVFIKASGISGIGLFAKSTLVEGRIICPYGGKITEKCTDTDYALDIVDGKDSEYTIDASSYGNLGRFANGELGATHNVVYEPVLGSSRVMCVLTVVTEIAPGEEIIAKYGEQYWENHKIGMEARNGNGNTNRNGAVTAKSKFKSKSAVNGSDSPLSSGSSPSVQLLPKPRKSCKRRHIETETGHNNANENGTDSEKSPTKKKSTSCANGDSHSSTISSTSSESSSAESGPIGLSQLGNTSPKTVSAPQGIIYFLRGTRQKPKGLELWSFNIKIQRFVHEGNLPQIFKNRRRLTMLHHQGDIYFMGGECQETGVLTNEAHIFNVESRNWRLMKMIKCRFDFQAAVCNNRIYTVGGCLENPDGPEFEEIGTDVVEKLSLDFPLSKWENGSVLINCRSDAGLVELNQKLYAIGGCVEEKKGGVMSVSGRCERFDPAIPILQNQWSRVASMNHKRVGLAAVAVSTTNRNRIFALGGTTSFDDGAEGLNIVEIYNPVKNCWKNGPPMNRRRKFFTAVVFQSCIYAIGGDDENGANKPTMEKFDLKTEKWTLMTECKVKPDGNFGATAFR